MDMEQNDADIVFDGGEQQETRQEQTESDGNAKPVLPEEPRQSAVRELFDWADTLVSVAIVLVLLFTFTFRPVTVDGTSMQDTLHDTDRVIICNLFYTPRQGDIVVLKKPIVYPGLDPDRPFIKRVIAVSGQTVDIDYAANTVAVDGVTLTEEYIYLNGDGRMRPPRHDTRQFAHYEVPEGCVFVLGDNRNNSLDSRYINLVDPADPDYLGYVDARYILGRLMLRIYPFDKFGFVKSGE